MHSAVQNEECVLCWGGFFKVQVSGAAKKTPENKQEKPTKQTTTKNTSEKTT